MLKALLLRQIGALERRWTYDASYMRLVARISPSTGLKFAIGTQMADRRAAPAVALAAASIVATMGEDCGPCTQIGVDMAAANGVDLAVLRAILAGDEAGMGPEAALAWRFARASLARDMEAADPLRDEVVGRWGEAGLVAVATALTAARMYPTLKYALGYGKTCARIIVQGEPAALARDMAA